MPRLPRIHVDGSIYYVTTKGSQGQQVFREKADYQMYLELLTKYKTQYGFKLFSYELEADRISLLIETSQDATISEIMHDLTSLYTKYYNAKYERKGSLFESRFRSMLVEKSAHLLEMTRYIHAGGGVETSYAAYSGAPSSLDLSAEIAEVKSFLKDKDDPKAYEKFCLTASPEELGELEKKLKRGSVLGSDAFAEAVRGRINEISKVRQEEGLPVRSRKRLKVLILMAGASALLATSSSLYLYVSKRDMESRYETLLSEKEAEFAEKSRFENRSPLSLTELEGTEWTIEIVPLPAGSAQAPVTDKIVFRNGRFTSRYFGTSGFLASAYFLMPRSTGAADWQTSQTTPFGDTLNWRAEWQGGLMKGVIEFRPKNGAPHGFSFFSEGWSYAKETPDA